MKKVLPREIYDFFDSYAGRSLIIKGHAGTGKTILSLTLLEEIADIDNSFYFSTRVSNKALYSQFDWLKDKDMRENLIDASMDFLRTLYDIQKHETKKSSVPDKEDDRVHKVEKARRVLGIFDNKSPDKFTPPENTSRIFLHSLMGDSDISELEEIYDRVDSRLPASSLIIIDSLESLIERYGVDPSSLIKALQKDLVELSGTKLIIVIEAEESTKWDYLVDGVLTLKVEEEKGRRTRQMVLNKLRGICIDRPVYLYTLADGKFTYASPLDPKLPLFEDGHEPILDGEGTSYWERQLFSTGSNALDEILGGGFVRNSVVLFEFSHDVPLAGQMNLFGPVLENFLAQERGVLFMPSSRDKHKFVNKSQLFEDKTKKYIKIIDMEDRERNDDIKHIFKDAYKQLKFKVDQPILTICDWVNIEHSIGQPSDFDEVDRVKIAKDMLDLMRKNSGLTIGLMGPGFSFVDNARYVADTHIKVFTKYNSLFMFGEKPNTEIYNITLDDKDHPSVRYVKQV